MSIPCYMGSKADMANIEQQELEQVCPSSSLVSSLSKREDIKPCFFHLEDLSALLTLLKETGHPCTQELSFLLGYIFARIEGDIKTIMQDKKELSLEEVQGLWDRLLQPDDQAHSAELMSQATSLRRMTDTM